METSNIINSFIIGSSITSTFVTFTYLIYFNKKNKSDIDYFSITPFLSIAFGCVAVVNYLVLQKYKNINYSLLVGAVFGFTLSLIGRFVLKIPKKTFKLNNESEYIVHVVATILYSLIMRYNISKFQVKLLNMKIQT